MIKVLLKVIFLRIIVLYDFGKLNLTESEKDLAILKVSGFKNKTLRKIFKREIYIHTLIDRDRKSVV